MPEPTQHCPICKHVVEYSGRYPRYVCATCAAQVTSQDGRPLSFGNEGIWGGFIGCYADTQEPYPHHECFIQGIPCYADEARFGGIVIEVVTPPPCCTEEETNG